jgi:hypothetical protein
MQVADALVVCIAVCAWRTAQSANLGILPLALHQQLNYRDFTVFHHGARVLKLYAQCSALVLQTSYLNRLVG